MTHRLTIDVSRMPPWAVDARTPVWWGNTLLMFIETTTVLLLAVSYYYPRQRFEHWPPPRVESLPSIERPLPDLGAATANVRSSAS